MISVEKASGIYAKLCAGERTTADERDMNELAQYFMHLIKETNFISVKPDDDLFIERKKNVNYESTI